MRRRAMEEHLVAEPDQLDPLVAQRFEDRPDFRERGVGLVEVEKARHGPILARRGLRAHRQRGMSPQ